MKFKDFLTKLKTDGKINQAEFITAIESAPDWEFPDKAIEAFESSFLTIDRASTDKTVHTKLKREILDPVDAELKPIIALIDQHDRFASSEIDKMTSTYDKIKGIQKYFPTIIEKVKKAPEDEDTKKKLKTFEESNQELLQRIEKMNTDSSEKEKFWEKQSEEKINSYRLDDQLVKRANKFTFGKAYSDPKVREELTKVRLDKLKAKHPLQLVDKDGQPDIQPLNKEGKPLFKDGSNTAVTIDHLLEDEFQDLIKASNVNDNDDSDSGSSDSEGRATKRFKIPDDKQKMRTGARTTVS